jgi:hypothetical protein
VSSALLFWHTFADSGLATTSATSGNTFWRLMGTVVAATASTWGYALVAALAFLGSLWFDHERARDLFDALDGEDDS